MTDTLTRDYGVGQARHNAKHGYSTDEHWLFSRIEAGMTIHEAREDFRDDWGDRPDHGWGFKHPELAAFCYRFSGYPIGARAALNSPHPNGIAYERLCGRAIYQRLKRRRAEKGGSP